MKEQWGRIFVAGGLIAVGGLWLLANLDILALDIGDAIGTWWPSVLILIGLGQLVASRGGSILGPMILIGLGALFLVVTLGWADWGIIWPAILIVIGVAVLFQGSRVMRRPAITGEDTVDLVAIFSGIERHITSGHFRGGRATAIFGGIEMDLRDAQPANDAILNITALFGGVEMKVPEGWNVQISGSPLFGAIEDTKGKRSAGEPDGPKLEIYASITFGGLEIKR